MEDTLYDLFESINYVEDDYEIVKLVDNFDLSKLQNYKFSEIMEGLEKSFDYIDPDLFPLFIEALYSSNNVRKFKIACFLIAKYANKMKYISRLEEYPLSNGKIKQFLPTLILVCKQSNNDVVECMFNIIKNTMLDYDFSVEEKCDIKYIIAIRIEMIAEQIKNNNNEIDKNTERLLLSLLVLIQYFNNDRIIRAVKDCLLVKNINIKLKVIEILMENNRTIAEEDILKVANNVNVCTKLFEFMRKKDFVEYLPNEILNQEYLAKINFIEWLEGKGNLGKAPYAMEFIGNVEDIHNFYYAYKFKEKESSEWKIGVSGGYDKREIPTLNTTGDTGSNYERFIAFDYVEQVKRIIYPKSNEKVANQF